MALDISRAPFPVRYRELWLPRAINENASLPSSRYDGHELAFTGARRGTTCDGVHFDGTATSNINCGAIHNAAAKLWISFRFKLDQPFVAGVANQFLWGKFLAGTDYIYAYLDNASGRINFVKVDGGALSFSLISAETTWNAGQWYHAIFSISSVNAARLIIENGTPVTDPDVSAVCNGGDLVFGDRDDPGAGTGFHGQIEDIFIGTDDLSQAAPDEEYDLYNGIPPADVVNEYPLDEGRGVTAYDRGSGGNNGTLDTTASWAWGRVRQPVISLDSINDSAVSAAAMDISGAMTFVWAGKMKSTYNALSVDKYQAQLWYDINNYLSLYYNNTTDLINWLAYRNAVTANVTLATKPDIDDYWILIGTYDGDTAVLYLNGALAGLAAGGDALPAGGTTALIGRNSAASNDISKPLMVAAVEGVFSQAQALEYSRFLDKVFNLGVVT